MTGIFCAWLTFANYVYQSCWHLVAPLLQSCHSSATFPFFLKPFSILQRFFPNLTLAYPWAVSQRFSSYHWQLVQASHCLLDHPQTLLGLSPVLSALPDLIAKDSQICHNLFPIPDLTADPLPLSLSGSPRVLPCQVGSPACKAALLLHWLHLELMASPQQLWLPVVEKTHCLAATIFLRQRCSFASALQQ